MATKPAPKKVAAKRPASRKAGSDKKPFVKVNRDLHQEVTDKIVAAIESGGLPWRSDKLWKSAPTVPYNAASGRTYRGMNHLYLLGESIDRAPETGGVIDPRFCSFKQAKDKGWNIKKGAKSVPVFFFKKVQIRQGNMPQDEAGKALAMIDSAKANGGKMPTTANQKAMEGAEQGAVGKTVWLLRCFPVFHASQIEGMPELNAAAQPDWDTSVVTRQMLDGLKDTGMGFIEGGNVAAYMPTRDALKMPVVGDFVSAEAYDHVLVHEMGHATGHASRLDRSILNTRESDEYAKEELVAEMTSAMICSQLGISDDLTRHAEYMKSWLTALKNDKRLLVKAAGLAASASDYLIDLVPELRNQIVAQRKVELDDATVDLDDVFDQSAIDGSASVSIDLSEFEVLPDGVDLSEFDVEVEGASPVEVAPAPTEDEDGPVVAGSALKGRSVDDPLMAASGEVDIGDWFNDNVEDLSDASSVLGNTIPRGLYRRAGMGM